MRRPVRRPAALIALTFAAMTIVTLAAPEAAASPCQKLWLWNPVTNECRPPPPPPPATLGRPIPPPPWYTQPPPWAPPWAPASVPPPPPTPAWAPSDVRPVWDPGRKDWGMWIGGVWVPL
jgi:hypothetical protein